MSGGFFSPPRVNRAVDGWEQRSLRSMLSARSERNRSDLPLLTVARERGVFVRSEDDANHNAIPEDLSNYKVARSGDLVINKMKAWQGSLGLAPVDGIVSPAYFVFSADFAVPEFGEYLLRSKPYVAKFAAASDGVRIGQWDLDIARMREIRVSLPAAEEQAAIVKYLAHANARIDKVIAAKHRLIALLTEQRRVELGARLSRPETRTQDRWFPAVRDGWSVVSLGRVIERAVDGPHFSPTYSDAGVPFLSARNIRPGAWALDDVKYVSEDLAGEFDRRVRPEFGDVLYTKGGTTGVAKAVDIHDRFQVWVHVAVLKIRRTLVAPEFLELVLNSPACYEQSQLETRGATNQDLGLGRMKRISIPLAPMKEQEAFVREFEAASLQIEAAMQRAQRGIVLLREFRTRLVADVVTGQVDVRAVAATLPDTPGSVDARGQEPDDDLEDVLGESED